MSEILVLVEGENDIEILHDELLKKEVKIISFDFLAHKSLKKLGITHSLSEEYFVEEDQKNIDEKAVDLTTNWYKHKQLAEFLEYDNLNIGFLLELEFLPYFFLHLKRIVGIKKILEKEHPMTIICSSLSEFADIVCMDSITRIIKYPKRDKVSLFYDHIEIPFKIGKTSFKVKVSRKRFLIIKKISEKIIDFVFHIKADQRDIINKNAILLLDFNIQSYQELLNSLSDAKQTILLLNQRRPAAWNLNSLELLRNSGCKIIQIEDFSTPQLATKIYSVQKHLESRLNSLMMDNIILNNIFSIEGIIFWNIIKKDFVKILKDRFMESVEKIVLFNELFENTKICCILEWAHVSLEEKIAIIAANKKKIPSIFLQHGLYPQNNKFEKYIPILPILPSNGSKEAVWGNVMTRFVKDHGFSDNEVITVGSPRHDIYFRQRSETRNKNKVLIASNLLFHSNFNGTDTRAFERLENYLKNIIYMVKKSGKEIIIKLHPSQAYYDITPFIHEIDPTISLYRDEDIRTLIEDCDCVISMNYSTVILDSMILNKPVMVILPEEQNFEEELPIIRKVVLCVSKPEELESKINDLLYNEEARINLINRGNEFVNDYISNQGMSSQYLANILKNY